MGPWAYTKSEQPDGDVCFDVHQANTNTPADICYSRVFKTYRSELESVQEAKAKLLSLAPELRDSLYYLRNCIQDGVTPALGEVNELLSKLEGATL